MEGAGALPLITLEGTLFCSGRFLTLVLYSFFCLCLFLHCPSPFLSFFLSVFPWSSLCFPPSWSLFVSSLPPTRSPLFPCSFFLTVPWLSWWTCWRRRWSQGAPGTLVPSSAQVIWQGVQCMATVFFTKVRRDQRARPWVSSLASIPGPLEGFIVKDRALKPGD